MTGRQVIGILIVLVGLTYFVTVSINKKLEKDRYLPLVDEYVKNYIIYLKLRGDNNSKKWFQSSFLKAMKENNNNPTKALDSIDKIFQDEITFYIKNYLNSNLYGVSIPLHVINEYRKQRGLITIK